MTMPGFLFSLSIMAAMNLKSADAWKSAIVLGLVSIAVSSLVRNSTAFLFPMALLRWLLISSLALIAGGIAFVVLVLTHPGLVEFRESLRARRRMFLLIVIVFTATVSPFEYGFSPLEQSSAGLVSVWGRYVLLLWLWVLVWLKHDESRWVLLPAVLLLLTRSIQSHAAGLPDWLAPVLADWAHFSFTAVWLGGVAMLALVFVPLALQPPLRLKELGIVLERFSPLAMFCVFGVALTGLAQSAGMVGSVDALLYTDYGRTIIVKIGLLVVLISFGAFHQQVISPRLQAWRLRDAANAQTAAYRLRWSIIAELVVSVILLAVVGLLVSLPLPMRTL
jgi:putative copper export protein